MYPLIALTYVLFAPWIAAGNFVAGKLQYLKLKLGNKEGSMKLGSFITGAVIAVFVTALLIMEFTTMIDAERPGASNDFNNTMDRLVSFAWIAVGFMAIAVFVIAANYIRQIAT